MKSAAMTPVQHQPKKGNKRLLHELTRKSENRSRVRKHGKRSRGSRY